MVGWMDGEWYSLRGVVAWPGVRDLCLVRVVFGRPEDSVGMKAGKRGVGKGGYYCGGD